MTTSAQSIVLDAQTALQDIAGVRWPAPELVGYLNDGQQVISTQRPDQTAWTYPIVLAAGHVHVLPAIYQALIDIPHNAGGRMARITKTDMLQLDAVEPNWRSRQQSTEIKHFMHDMREPRVFQVYPPAVNGTVVNAVVSEYPAPVGTPGGAAYTTVTGNISLPDHWKQALTHYVLFRSYAKDAEFGGNAELSASHLALFNAAIGSQLQSTGTVAPKT